MDPKELPIFFDQTGKRWRRAKWILFALLLCVVVVLWVLVPALASPAMPVPPTYYDRPPSVQQLEAAFNAQNTPVVGQGQFIRAVKVERRADGGGIKDVFSGSYVRDLTREEVIAVGKNQYALERYGQVPDRQLVLTFDDGPDPVYTSRLLDMLSKHNAPSTFFVVGANVVKHPELTKRIVNEGHTVGNHTFSHIDFDFASEAQGEQEINQTSRVFRAVTGHSTSFIRVPYAGATDQSLRDSIKGILQSQQLGYSHVAYDYDTKDWTFTANQRPDPRILDGSGKILLLHDAGGDRTHTINYIEQLIPMAKRAGYSFVNLEEAHSRQSDLYGPASASFTDKIALTAGKAVLVWPHRLVLQLFAFNVAAILIITSTNIILAFAQRRRSRKLPRVPHTYRPEVSVIVPAYNEAAVLEKSVRSVLASRYKNFEILIVDDGSRDNTLQVAKKLASKYPKVKVLHQRNQGKSAALNNGVKHAMGEILICIDADTVFTRSTIWRLTRHFYDARVGGVAGYVRVGNIRNLLTRWQAAEYITSIALERNAQAFLGAITVVPGACGAWRREAIQAVAGFSGSTLAEDCDIALSVHQAGYAIVQDTTAMSYTECPLTLKDLAKQRFRWLFGNIQSHWKHRRMFFKKKYGWLGMVVLPNATLSVLMPMIFWPFLLVLAIANVLTGRWWVILLFLAIAVLLQIIVAGVALVIAKEKFRHLLVVPLTRFVYGPIRIYAIYRSLLLALKGALVGWNKLSRTSTVKPPPERTRPFRAAQRAAED
ncbi:MAG TPA: bifunctional polysaccharide deacetylase/glycosyltransferase family 2 protein [Candidatus Saccharimonadales bacterium]